LDSNDNDVFGVAYSQRATIPQSELQPNSPRDK
jgi:hypothetical protein